jgi:hypothetical protein
MIPLANMTSTLAQPVQQSIGGDIQCESMISDTTKNVSSSVLNVLPPEIIMIYNGKEYQGELSESKYREGETFSDLHIPPENITANLPLKIVNIDKNSCIQFIIKGTPRILPPSSLDISAYTVQGSPVAVLNATENDSSTFPVNLDNGKYILLSAATWVPSSEQVTGYVIYKFLVNVTTV